jgi:MerR family transcriptional regulator, aldehyde-responsive regulator
LYGEVVAELTIKQMSSRTNLSLDTLRYYEKLGLLTPRRDTHSNHRRYSEEDVKWLEFVLTLRKAGMPLETIKDYGELYLEGDTTLAKRRITLEAHAKTVKAKMAELQQSLEVIQKKMRLCKRLEKKGNL